jgi:hypothetical protein
MWTGMAQTVQRLATGWTVWGSNPGGGEIFHTRPDRPWALHSLLYNEHRVYFPAVKRPGRDVNHPPPFSVEVKEREELYFYSPSGCGWTGHNPAHVWETTHPFLLTALLGNRSARFETWERKGIPETQVKLRLCPSRNGTRITAL